MLPPPEGDDVLTEEEHINDEHVLEDPYAKQRDVEGGPPKKHRGFGRGLPASCQYYRGTG